MLKWTPKSEQDLIEIREHIASSFNVDLAIETINKLVDFVEESLSKNPLLGSVLESNPLFFKLVYEGNSIYYCENPSSKDLYVVYIQPRGTKLKKIRLSADDVA